MDANDTYLYKNNKLFSMYEEEEAIEGVMGGINGTFNVIFTPPQSHQETNNY
jgi:hypothetical protein